MQLTDVKQIRYLRVDMTTKPFSRKYLQTKNSVIAFEIKVICAKQLDCDIYSFCKMNIDKQAMNVEWNKKCLLLC